MSTAARIRLSAVAIGALVSFGLIAVDAQAVQIPFKPVADAHVSKVKKKANYGRSKRLVVSPQVTAYLKFNVRGLPGTVSFASLQMVAFNSSLRSVVVRRAAANHWRENAIRFSNAPKKFAGPKIRLRRVKQFRVASVDVTKLVRGNGPVTLVVMASGRGGASFASGETKESILRPLLIVGVNEAPTCRAVSFGTNEDTAETASPDCTDTEKDPMSYEIVSQGNQGSASIADGKLRYVPRPDANGTDTFLYRAKDGRKWSKPVAATVRITAVNDAPVCHNIGLAMDEDAGNAVHANCSDVDNDPLAVSVMAVAANGKSWEVGNELRYEPKPNFHGVDSFTYRARDTTLGSAPATVSVTVRPVNDAPTCQPVAFPTDEDAPREWDPACSDIDGDPLGYGIAAHGSKGSASIAGGKLRYAPNLNLNGGDTFMYAASDGSAWSAPTAASVDILPVNDTPVCSDVALVTDEEVLGEQDPACTDFDGDPLSYAIVTNGQKGNASVGASKLRYLPNVNALGADSFTYQATDGTLTSAPATVSVTIRQGNDAPVCANVPLNVGEDTPAERDPSCADVDGDPLTYEIVDQGGKGTASVVGGRLRYAPNPNVFGSDSFTYRALDGITAGAPATVNVSITAVNDAPTCSPLPLVIAEDTSGEANPICSDIEGDPLTFSIVSQGTRGVASVAAGKLRYVPLLNVNGGDSFTYRAHDALTSSAATTVSVTIGAVNDAPACSPVTLTTTEDTQAERDPVCSDVEGDTLSYSIFGQGAKGAASVVAGRLRYVPDANANGADSFTYRATDGVANSAAATTSVSIAAVNDAPVCSPVALNIAQDLIGTVAPSCTDVELARGETSTPLTYSIATQGAKGLASVSGSNLVYDPNPGATGSDSFTYTARDGALTSAAAPVNVSIGDVNDAPSCLARTLTVAEDGFGTVAPSCSDPENDPLTYSIVAGQDGAKGTASVVAGQLRYDADPNATGADTFSYVARDGALTSAPATVTVTITPVNDAPVCSDVALTTSEDTPNEQNPACTDVDGNPLTYSIVAGGTKGTASIAAGRLRFVPGTNATGADSFTYRANDGTVNSNVATVSVTITPVNDAPTCSAVSLTTNEDVPGEADPNCSDVENDPLTYSIVAPTPTKGTASVTGAGKLRFAPNLNATGADGFSYRAFDGVANSGAASVSVTITAVNDAPVCADVALTTNEDTQGERDPSCSDVEGSTLSYSIVAPATRGTASVVAGRLRYVPGANVNGLDSFTYRANDGTVNSNVSTVSVTITSVNDAPTCSNVSLATNEDVPGETNPNCSDIDGDALSYSIVSQGAKGTASVVVSSGRLRYAPDPNVNGADTFTYRASDPGNLSSAAATVTVSVAAANDAPVCQAVSKELDEDSNITISPSCTDVEGSPLSYSIRTQPSQGTATVEGSLLRYVALPNASGGDSFTYDASDGTATSAPATVTVTVAAVNDPPVCQARTMLLDEDATFGSATPVCTDPEGDPIAFSIPANGQGTKGTAQVVAGQLRYTPNLNANGADSFTYVASDGQLTSIPATVSVTITPVNDAPACSPVTLTTNEDTPGERDPSCSDVDGDALNYSIVAQGNKGTASVVTGKLRYVPSANANGTDTFTYRATDGTLNSTAASANVTITPVNDAPVCQALPLSTNEDTPAEISPSCSDIDGDSLTYSIATPGTKGTASIAAGRLRYVPAANQNGADSFTYQANDPLTSSAPATVTVSIAAVNDAPTCVDRALSLDEDTTGSVAPLCTDVEGDPMSFAIVAPAGKGTASLVAGELRYAPNLNANGPDSFTYRANDGFLNGPAANVAVTIRAVNDAPVCSNVTLVTGEDSQGETDPSCTDVDGNPLTFSIVAQGPKGTASVAAGRLRYSPNLNVTGADTFTYSASDGSLLSAPANAAVTIQPVNDAPVCVGVSLATNEDTPGETSPSCSDVDTGTTLTYSVVAPGAKGTASVVVATNKLRYVPTLNANGGDTFTYQASDGLLSSTAAPVSVSIAPVNDAPACANVTFSTNEDVSADADPICTDVDGGVLTYSIAGNPSIGSASVVANKLRYTPNPNSHSSDSFSYRATDSGGLDSPAATATVTINPVNDAPSCSPVTLLTTEDAVGETNPSCSDVDGDALTYSIASPATIGTASVVAGKLRYTPNANVTGTDSFTYRATDGGSLQSGPATVSVTIGPANDAPNCSNVSLATNEDTMAERDPSCTDIDNDPLTYSIETQGTKGTASVVGNKLRYVPNANANGADSFTYKAHDGVRFSTPATVTVSITAVNDRPVCADIGLVTDEELAGERDPSCTDVDGQALTISIFGQGAKGTASMAGSRLRYVPRLNENGADSFTYRADDGAQISLAATVSVEIRPINDVPQCTDVSFAATEDVLSEADPSCTDIDGDALTYSVVLAPSRGTASVAGNKLRYLSNLNLNGPDSFTYRANDGTVNSNSATASVSVAAVNDAPACAPLTLNGNEDAIAEISPSCSDVEGNPITVSVASQGQKGNASLVAGKLRYVPQTNTNGADSFTYRASDSLLDGTPATVSVNVAPVNDAPVCSPVSFTTDEDVAAERDPSCTDIDSGTLTYEIVAQGTKGSATVGGGKLRYAPSLNLNGGDTFTYRASDGPAQSAAAPANVTINAINDAPACPAQTLTIDEDSEGTVTPVCTDPENDPVTLEIAGPPLTGAASVVGSSLRYVGSPNTNGLTSFTYRARDTSSAASAAATVSVTIRPVNDAPVCTNLTLTTPEDTLGTIAPVCNDIDAGDTLTYSIVGQGLKGQASVLSGQLRFAPTANLNGPDSFTYKASDGSADSNTATVAVGITPVNDAPVAQNLSSSTSEDTAKALTLSATDIDGDGLTYSIIAAPANGVLSGTGANRTYTPNANYFGPDSFTYRVNDGLADSNIATVSLTVLSVNDAPVAQDLSVSTPEDTAKAVTLSATDIEGSALNFTIVSGPAHGLISSGTSANRTYTPAANYNGPDSFTYRANDGFADSNVATVTITVDPVNDAPACPVQSLTINEDSEGTVTPTCVDVEGSSLSLEIVSQGTKGAASVVGSSLRYVANPNANGADSFTYRATDGVTPGAAATVSVTITPVNDTPTCADVPLATTEDTPVERDPSCTDIDSGSLTYTIASPGSKGSASVTAGGKLRYVPNANEIGTDSFTYRASDGSASSAPATVTVTIGAANDAPVAQDLSVSTPEDTAKALTLAATDVEGDPLTYTIVSGPTNGTLSGGTGADRTYTPNANYNGADSFTYRANDGTANSNVATVTLTVTPVNDAPVAQNLSSSTPEDTAKALTLAATDVDAGTTLTYTIVSGPTHGAISPGTGASRTYTPAANYNGPDSFTYKANDGSLDSNTATVTLTVDPVNDAPTCSPVSLATNEDAAVEGDPVCTDVEGNALTHTIVTQPGKGTASVVGGRLRYVPNANANGPDSFTYRASDAAQGAPATVSVDITPVNDAPFCPAQSLTIDEDGSGIVTPFCTDPEGNSITLEIVDQGLKGSASVVGSSLHYVANPGVTGSDSFTFRPRDGAAAGAPATVSVTISAVNDPPTCADLTLATDEDVAAERDPSCTDIDSGSLTYSIAAQGSKGSASVTAGNRLRYVPNANQVGTDSFTYRASDGGATSAPATVTVTITGVNDAPTCANVTLTTNEDTTGERDPACTDVDGGTLTYSIVTDGTKGSATVGAGKLRYAPNANLTGADTFTYRATDATSLSSSPATVSVTITPVNDAPVAQDLSASTPEDTAKALTLAVNDVDGNPPTYTIVSGPAHGTLTGTGANRTYTPAANYNGPDSFTYRANDTFVDSNVATVSITVDPVNDTPSCSSASLTIAEDSEGSLTPSCTDPEGSSVSLSIEGQGTKGTASVVGSSLRYVADPNKNLADSFTFRPSDGAATGAPAAVSVTINPVNDAPTCSDVALITTEDVMGERDPVCADVDGDALTYSIAGQGTLGTASVVNNKLQYLPNANVTGSDSFTYQASDATAVSNAATVAVTINAASDPPACSDVTMATAEDTAAAVDPACTDADGAGALSYSIVLPGQKGSASIVDGKLHYVPAANVAGTDTFGYVASDGTSSSAPATVSVTITAVNDAPVCADVTLATTEDVPAERDPACTDVDNATLTYSIAAQGSLGAASVAAGKLRYAPAANATGSDSFTYEASDGLATSTPASVLVSIAAANDPPVADDLSASTAEDTAKALTLSGSDVDGDSFGFQIVSGPIHGSLTGTGADRTYTPAPNYHGSDTFTYRANDGFVDSDVATVTLSVTPVNDAPVTSDLSASTSEDVAKALTLAASDVDGDPLNVTIVAEPTHGTLSGTGAVRTYTPDANYQGPDSFTYKANDGTVDSNVSTVTLTVNPANDAPVCSDVSLATSEDVAVEGDPVCSDVEGNALTYSIVAQAGQGTASVVGGKLRYVPAPNATGSDSFTYRASDTADGAPATVSVTITPVNDAPACATASLTADEDGQGTVAPACVDPEGDPISLEIVDQGLKGSASVVGTSLRYVPAANVNGSDSFTYRAGDGALTGATAVASVTINPVNDAPVCVGVDLATDEDAAAERDPACTDIDGDALTYSIVADGTKGSASVSAGRLRYTPYANANGADTFTYRANDNATSSAAATVSVTINPLNDAPTCAGLALTTDEDATAERNPSCADVDGDSLTYSIVANGSKGSASVVDGKLRYTPNANEVGADSFSYQASDGAVAGVAATVSVTITSVNDAPSCADVTLATGEDVPAERNPSCSDVDGGTLAYAIVGQPAKGAATVVDGKLRYVPAPNATGADSFTYQATDGVATSAAATVAVTITAVNDAPVAQDLSLSTPEDTAKAVLLGATDAEGDALSFTIVSGPTQGSLSGTGADRTYTPNANYHGADSFTYRVNDGSADSNLATVNLSVTPVNDAPVAQDLSASTTEDTARDVTLAATDLDGDPVSFTIVSDPAHGTISGTGANRTYTPAANYSGPDSFTYKANDGGADSNVATVNLTIDPVNDAPVCPAQTLALNEDASSDVTPVCTDAEGGALSLEIVGQGLKGAASVVGASLHYAAAPNAHGADTFTYRASDGTAAGAPASVSVTITPVNDAPGCANAAISTDEDIAGEADPACTDIDGDALTYAIAAQGTQGTASVVDNKLRYIPNANANGADSFTYEARDGLASSPVATTSVTIRPVNDAPSCSPVALTTDEDVLGERDPACTDVDGDSLTYAIGTQGSIGTASVASGKLRYLPNLNANGSDTFSYVANDGLAASAADVSVTVSPVNDAPACVDVPLVTDEDVTGVRDPACTDADGDSLTYAIITDGTKGTASVVAGKLRYVPNLNVNGADSFTYRALDASTLSGIATVSVTITPINDAPTCADLALVTDEDTSAERDPSCTDIDGGTQTYSIVSQGTKGVASVVDGRLRYVPALNATGTDSFTYRASDPAASGPAAVAVTINAVNDAPSCANVTLATDEDVQGTTPPSCVDPEGDPFSVEIVDGATQGSASVVGSSLRYLPNANVSGSDSFTYRASDGALWGAAATVSVTIDAVNDAPVCGAADLATDEDTAAERDPVCTDIDSGSLTYTIDSQATKGTASVAGNRLRYAPNANATGGDSFTYQASDGAASSAAATVSVTIAGVNDAPSCAGVPLAVGEDTPAERDPSCTDVDGQSLAYEIVADGTKGTASVVAGKLRYAPNLNATGADTFTYRASDGVLTSDPATVNVTIAPSNDAPSCMDVGLTVTEDTPAERDPSCTDVDGDGLSYAIVDQGANGTASVVNGKLRYAPNANATGSDSFTYRASDGTATSAAATVAVTIDPVNDAPSCTDLALTTDEGVPAERDPACTDLENNVLTYSIVAQGTKGTASVVSGKLRYVPNAGATGADNFTYRASEGGLDSAPATVSVTIVGTNDPPACANVSLPVTEDTMAERDPSCTDPEGTALTYSIAAQGLKGVASVVSGKLRYVPSANATGTDSFTYRASDGSLSSAPATVSVTITGVNDAPVCPSPVLTIDEETDGIITPNCVDPEGDLVTLTIADPQPANGTAGIFGAELRYVPNVDFNGVDAVKYRGSDGQLTGPIATVSVVVNPVNDEPEAIPVDTSTPKGVAKVVTLDGFDYDVTDTVSFRIISLPANGVVRAGPNATDPVINASQLPFAVAGNQIRYEPAAGFTGVNVFQFVAHDGTAAGFPADIRISVLGANVAPVCTSRSLTLEEDGELWDTGICTDADGDPLTFTRTGPTHGQLTVFDDASFNYVPDANYNGPDSFTISARDPSGLTSAVVTVTLTITPVNDLPTCLPFTMQTTQNTPVVTFADCEDVDENPLTYAIVSQGTKGTASVDPDGRLRYVPNLNATGADSFTFTVSDGVVTSAPQTAQVSIAP